MTTANDRLSRCVTALLKLAVNEADAYEEIDALYAPSECADLVRRDVEERALRVLAAHGYTAREFAETIEARTSERFVETEVGSLILSVLPADETRDEDRLACCASELLQLARCEEDAARECGSNTLLRARVEHEARETLARHGVGPRDLIAAVRERARRIEDPADPWYLAVLPSDAPCVVDRPVLPSGPGEYEVTVGYWEEVESYQLGTLVLRAASRSEARRRGIEMLVAPELLEDGCEPWALVEPALARPSRSARRTYSVTVGHVSRVSRGRAIGFVQLRAGSAREGRERAIRALFDAHYRAANHTPWARAERFDM